MGCEHLDDVTLVARFEALELAPHNFGHREHVRLAFAMLAEAGDFGDAAIRYRRALRAFASHVGAAGKYHETLTWAYLALVHERMYLLLRERDHAATTSFDLLARYSDLLDHRAGALARYYDLAALTRSTTARAVFVLPERK
jgi:hypothetical protein